MLNLVKRALEMLFNRTSDLHLCIFSNSCAPIKWPTHDTETHKTQVHYSLSRTQATHMFVVYFKNRLVSTFTAQVLTYAQCHLILWSEMNRVPIWRFCEHSKWKADTVKTLQMHTSIRIKHITYCDVLNRTDWSSHGLDPLFYRWIRWCNYKKHLELNTPLYGVPVFTFYQKIQFWKPCLLVNVLIFSHS